jgi:large subunit ribosomal protein L10
VKTKQKKALIEKYRQFFKGHHSLFLINNDGLTVQDSKDIRLKLEAVGAKFLVVKNTLARIAVRSSHFALIRNYLSGPIALIYAEEPIVTAKVLTNLVKRNIPIRIVASVVEGNIFNASGVAEIANLFERNEICARIMSLFSTAPGNLIALLKQPSSRLIRVLKARTTK